MEDNKTIQTSKVSSWQPYLVPLAILASGIFVAGAIMYTSGNNGVAPSVVGANPTPAADTGPTAADLDKMNPVTDADHIKGNPNAPVKIVEYSDFECPFCKRFHDTMNEVMDKYIESGEVAWVFRQFPLEQLHPVKAQAAAVASECANELGGNDAFWQFTDTYFERTLTNNRTDIETVIPQIVRDIGLNETAFAVCFTSGKYDEHIESDIADAVETGGRGTPWSIVVGPDGKKYPLNGALPLQAVEQLINAALGES